jgi:hypothetical protein
VRNSGKSEKAIDNPTNHGKIGLLRIVLIRIYTFLPIVDKIEGRSAENKKNSLTIFLNLNGILIIT